MPTRRTPPPARAGPRKQPRQQRAQATLDTLFDATTQVLLQQGEAAFTTNRVAERSGYSVGTLYQYFPDKQTLLRGLMERERRRAMRSRQRLLAEAIDSGTPLRDALHAYIRQTVADFGTGSPARRAMVRLGWRSDDALDQARALDDMAAFLAKLLRRLGGADAPAPDEARLFVLTRGLMGTIRSASLEASPLLGGEALVQALADMAFDLLCPRGAPG